MYINDSYHFIDNIISTLRLTQPCDLVSVAWSLNELRHQLYDVVVDAALMVVRWTSISIRGWRRPRAAVISVSTTTNDDKPRRGVVKAPTGAYRLICSPRGDRRL